MNVAMELVSAYNCIPSMAGKEQSNYQKKSNNSVWQDNLLDILKFY